MLTHWWAFAWPWIAAAIPAGAGFHLGQRAAQAALRALGPAVHEAWLRRAKGLPPHIAQAAAHAPMPPRS